MKSYIPTIGIEVHAELKTNTKMFCDSKNDPHAHEPNVHICPICMGHPGTLPVVNKTAVAHVIKVGIALGSEIATYTEFDRKNYFYPDIPKGYQISQYAYPLVKGGELCGVRITRVHLEEDTARSLHDQGDGSIIDYNRAGVPLMELVTEPVIHDAKTAGNFARELQLLLRTLGVSDANMEKGEMRVEANISVSQTEIFGTKVEIKNLNSFKSVENAIEYEIKRQITALELGEKVVQETRGWDEMKGKTYSQRVKESAHDYRYFPDPDIPKFDLTAIEDFSRVAETLPKLPSEKRKIYTDIGLTIEQSEIILSNARLDEIFESALTIFNFDVSRAKLFANYLLTDLLPLLTERSAMEVNVAMFVELIEMLHLKLISSRVAKDILREVIEEGKSPRALVLERNLMQSDSTETLMPIILKVIDEHAGVVFEYKNGKDTALQFLVGQGMKLSKGSANPQSLAQLFEAECRK